MLVMKLVNIMLVMKLVNNLVINLVNDVGYKVG